MSSGSSSAAWQSATALASALLALVRLRARATLVPATALALLVVANLPSIDGLGRAGWKDLLELGRSGWSDRTAMGNFAHGPFSYELELARANVGPADRIVSSNGRLTYFFPGRVDVRYARSCSELVGAQQGIYGAFVVGDPPARPPLPEDCRITSTPVSSEARDLRRGMDAIGYSGVKTERTGCSEFRVVVTGDPDGERVRDEFRSQAAANGFTVSYAPAVRFPEVRPEVAAVR